MYIYTYMYKEVCKWSDISYNNRPTQSTKALNNTHDSVMYVPSLSAQSDSSTFLHPTSLLKYVLNCEQNF
jgi:hypothetical protein